MSCKKQHVDLKLIIFRKFGKNIWEIQMILDIFRNELESREKIEVDQIISEIANYWRSWRLSQENQETKLLSRANRFFKRLATGNANTKERENKYLQISPATVASLDTVVANLETNTIIPVSRAGVIVRQRGGKLIQTVKTKIDIFFYGNRGVTVSEQKVIVEESVEKQSKIKALISAALKYFYAEPEAKKIKHLFCNDVKSINLLNKSVANAADFLSKCAHFN